LAYGVRNDNHHDASGASDDLSAFLTMHVAIRDSACQGISEHVYGLFEAQEVLSLIGKVFRFIPLKKHWGNILQ
jgi:hypothetical protein